MGVLQFACVWSTFGQHNPRKSGSRAGVVGRIDDNATTLASIASGATQGSGGQATGKSPNPFRGFELKYADTRGLEHDSIVNRPFLLSASKSQAMFDTRHKASYLHVAKRAHQCVGLELVEHRSNCFFDRSGGERARDQIGTSVTTRRIELPDSWGTLLAALVGP